MSSFPAVIPRPHDKRSDAKEKYRCEHDRRILPPVTSAEDGVEHEAGDRPGDAGAGGESWRGILPEGRDR